MAQFSRRHVLGLGVGALAAARLTPALADNGAKTLHGLSAFGELKYPADFPNLAYVNSDAPKGGMFSQLVGSGGSTFNSLNAFIVKGDRANGMELTFASLMARAFDEPDAVYLLAADELNVSPDGLVFRFRLRPGITFHDGSEITASDVAFSLTTLKSKGHPAYSSVLRDLADATAEDKRTVQLRFQPTRGLDVPALAAAMPIFSEKYYSTRRCHWSGGTRTGLAGPVRRDLAGCATGVRALSRCAFRAGSIRRIRACEELVGREASGLPRSLQFRDAA